MVGFERGAGNGISQFGKQSTLMFGVVDASKQGEAAPEALGGLRQFFGFKVGHEIGRAGWVVPNKSEDNPRGSDGCTRGAVFWPGWRKRLLFHFVISHCHRPQTVSARHTTAGGVGDYCRALDRNTGLR
jgi:hypothetical protein